MRLIDSHCHLDDVRFDTDREAVIERAAMVGIDTFVVPAVTAAGWPRLRELVELYPCMYPAYGLHPWFCERRRPEDLTLLAELLPYAKAVGECGLDAMRKNTSLDDQLFWFRAQLKLAAEFDLPVIVHAVKSLDLVLRELKGFAGLEGVIHSFYGSRQQADTVIGQGFYLGIGSAVTQPQNSRFQKLVATLPLEMLLIETDAPDQSPATHRGERNEPAFLLETLDSLAMLHDKPAAEVAAICSANAQELFSL